MARKKGFPHDNYFKVPNAVFGARNRRGWIELTDHRGLSIYLFILRRYDHGKQECPYESHRSMAKRLGISKTTLEKHLDRLRHLGLIDRRPEGRGKHPRWRYVPRLPLPDLPPPEDGNGPVTDPINGPIDGPKEQRMDRLLVRNGPNDEKGEIMNVVVEHSNESDSKSPKRLYKRLNKEMSLEEEMEYVTDHPDHVPLSRQVQLAWRYWCRLWETQYRRPYYASKCKENSKFIGKDKKNLRDKIEAVGFADLIARMERCFRICDERFPCMDNGRWVKPISIDIFISNHFFNQWIEPRRGGDDRLPTSVDEKVKAAMRKRGRAAGHGEVDPAKAG